MTTERGWSRRRMLAGGLAASGAAIGLSGCGTGIGTGVGAGIGAGMAGGGFYGLGSRSGIERRVDVTRDYLLSTYPSAAQLVQAARGVLYMPLVTEVAFGPGGSYGEGALRVDGQTADYYSAAQATVGVQAGAQQYAHALIFTTDAALAAFRASPGWVAGADAFYALPTGGLSAGIDTLMLQHPVVAMIFGQAGLMAGAAIEGTKYTRITLSRA